MAVGVTHEMHCAPFWGEKSCTLDWCEENYKHSSFIAEFCTAISGIMKLIIYFYVLGNSTSNFLFMYVAVKGMHDTIRAKLPIRFTILYGWVFTVGLGSLLFHATLKWSMQLLDEIPMIYMACQILHCFLYPSAKEMKTAAWWRKSVWPLYAVSIAVTFAYVISGNAVFHQVCFGAILVGCAISFPSFADRNTEGLADAKKVRAKAFNLLIKAAALMIAAFGIWNVDNMACYHLRAIRNYIESNNYIFWMSPLLQFHAIWHIMTIAAADYTVVGVVYVWCQGLRGRASSKNPHKEIEVSIKKKLFGALPQIEIHGIADN